MLRIEIPRKMFTNNEIKRWYNNPRGRFTGAKMYASWKETLKEEIFFAVPSHCNIGAPRVKKGVKVLYITKKKQDKDNFYASLKPLLDSMVDLELIRDDSEEWITLIATQKVDTKEAYKIVIEVI
jgi:hypothetical protein